MKVILGIGNPGRQYDGTRHNLGFAVIDALVAAHGLGAPTKRFDAECWEWRLPSDLGDGKALLLKPRTFVNLSGQAAQAALAFYKVPPADLLVLVDDLNLALGDLRLRPTGSAGGHNGLRDIEAKLGQGYCRLRLGMGPLPPGADQVGFVLGGFAPEQQADARALVTKATDCCRAWLREGCVIACSFNGPLRPPPPRAKPPRPEAPPSPQSP
jgi:PTH1 family peptidyl-tRNA hydrolase